MLEHLKKAVCQANLDLVREGLVIQTWGNASAADRAKGLMVIKPSGVPYEKCRPATWSWSNSRSGRVVEGDLNPSSDTDTHLVLYRAFNGIAGVVHTHSLLPPPGLRLARPVPPSEPLTPIISTARFPAPGLLTPTEIETDYETNTGRVILEAFEGRDPLACPAVLVANHGPFAWGTSVRDAVHNAVVLEHVIRLAGETLRFVLRLQGDAAGVTR